MAQINCARIIQLIGQFHFEQAQANFAKWWKFLSLKVSRSGQEKMNMQFDPSKEIQSQVARGGADVDTKAGSFAKGQLD